MKYYLAVFIGITSFLSAASDDFEALRAWIATKRQVTVKERGGSLSLSGDLRAEYTAANEHENGFKSIGSNSLHPLIGSDQFRITFNSLLDYRSEATWASIRLKFNNIMGVTTGTTNRLNLDRAFMGFRIVDAERFSIDLEPGRRKLNYAFDSRIEFAAFMDGLLIKYDQSSDRIGDFYIHGGPFVVNEVKDLFAYVFEAGVLNIYNTGVYAKYSFIDWATKHFSDPIENQRFRYLNSQFILGYRFNIPKIDKVAVLYNGFLINSAAETHNPIVNYRKANLACYSGFTIGEARRKGDWAIDTNIQYIQPQSIPDFDFNGIGVGLFGDAYYPNYLGGIFEFLYLITDNLTIAQSLKYSHSLDYLTTSFSSTKYRLEFIYAW